jgi:chorismate dehydratase
MIWRLGTVPYLNADPLAAALREQDVALLVGDAVELSAEVPSQLIGSLLRGSVEAALVSTAAVVPHRELSILPEMCISSRGPVRSITLYSRAPLREVRTVALDASSRSAHALTQVLLAEKWGRQPEFRTLPPDLPRMLEQADAALLIGNPALVSNYKLDSGDWPGLVRERYDLGEVWTDLTGLPFVYAIWAVAPEALSARSRDIPRLTRLLLRAKAWGLRRRGMLAARGAEELGLPYDLALDYITEAIRYDLGAEERAGMERFCELAVRHGVLPESSAVRFAEAALASTRL